MKLKRGEWFLVFFNAIYIIGFLWYYLSIQNYEFLWYIAVIVIFGVLILATIRKSNFDYVILWGLSVWGLMHMLGGGLIVNGDVLYAYKIFPIINSGDIFVLKFDQFVHFFGFGVCVLVAEHLLKNYFNEKVNCKIVYPALVLIGMGLGSLNEIVEFVAVVLFPQTGVGGYYNTALDMVFNGLGAVAAVLVVHLRRKYRKDY